MLLTATILFLLLSALFSGSEIAYVSADKLRVELKKRRETRRSKIMAEWFDRPSDFLSTMLVGNNIALVAFTSLVTVPLTVVAQHHFGVEAGLLQLLVVTVMITLIVLVFGEYVPKTIFRLLADDALYFFALPLRVLQSLLYLPSRVMRIASDVLLRVFFKRPSEELDTVLTRRDLQNFVNRSQYSEEETAIDTTLFGKALNLGDKRLKDCMVPRTEIASIDVEASIEELEEKLRETRLSRILITEGDIDGVLGYIHHQQLLDFPETIRDCVLEITFIPEVARVTDILNQSVKQQLSIACVVNEYGGIAGIVTMEDLLEQIFGEIEDEYDEDDYIEVAEADGTFRFSGRLEISYLNENYGLGLPEGDYQTLSGFIVNRAERVPDENEELELEGFHFKLLEVTNTRIQTVRLTRPEPEAE